MNITITPTQLKGRVIAPPSKSQAHRLIIAAALADGESVIRSTTALESRSYIDMTVDALRSFGVADRPHGPRAGEHV